MKTITSHLVYRTALYGALVSLVIAICILSCVPPISRDALIHHLAIPKLYIKHGGIYEIPDLFFSYFPMNLDLLYMIPLYFGNDIIPKFIHFGFTLISTVLIYRYLLRRLNQQYALLGCVFFLSIPIIIRNSSTVYVDMGLVCFLFASLLYLFRWVETGFRTRHLCFSAIFCGLALGTKYNALIGFFLLTMFVPFVYARYHPEKINFSVKAIGNSLLYVLIALIVFSPWMIRDIAWTGNPVYPLYQSLLSPPTISDKTVNVEEPEAHSPMNHFQLRRNLYDESGWEIALIPLRVFFQGEDNNPKYFDGKANPFLLLLPVFAVLGLKKDKPQIQTEKRIMLYFSILFLLFAYVQTVIRIRYIAPIIPPLVILSIFGLYNIKNDLLSQNRLISKYIKKIILFSIVSVMLCINVIYIVSRFNYVKPLPYLLGKISRDDYIQRFWPEYATIQYANRHLTKKSKILGIYAGNRGYYSDIKITFSLDMLQKLAAGANEPKDIINGLREKNITHLFINFKMFNFWVKSYSMHEKKLLKEFFEKYTVNEFSKEGYGLLHINYSHHHT